MALDPLTFSREWRDGRYVTLLAMDNWPDETTIDDELLSSVSPILAIISRDGDRLTFKVENGLATYKLGKLDGSLDSRRRLSLISASIDRVKRSKA